jgi:hypothetical protein
MCAEASQSSAQCKELALGWPHGAWSSSQNSASPSPCRRNVGLHEDISSTQRMDSRTWILAATWADESLATEGGDDQGQSCHDSQAQGWDKGQGHGCHVGQAQSLHGDSNQGWHEKQDQGCNDDQDKGWRDDHVQIPNAEVDHEQLHTGNQQYNPIGRSDPGLARPESHDEAIDLSWYQPRFNYAFSSLSSLETDSSMSRTVSFTSTDNILVKLQGPLCGGVGDFNAVKHSSGRLAALKLFLQFYGIHFIGLTVLLR